MKKINAVKVTLRKSKSKKTATLQTRNAEKIKDTTSSVKRMVETESFDLGNIIREARIFKNLTQEVLAKKCGTTKYYISRIENNGSDIRLSTLMRIVKEGPGGILKFTVDFDLKAIKVI